MPAPSQFAAVKQKRHTRFHALFQLSGKTQSCFTFVAVGLQNALAIVEPPQFKVLADTQPYRVNDASGSLQQYQDAFS